MKNEIFQRPNVTPRQLHGDTDPLIIAFPLGGTKFLRSPSRERWVRNQKSGKLHSDCEKRLRVNVATHQNATPAFSSS